MPTIHPLPVNPTTGQQPLASLRSVVAIGSGSGVGGSNGVAGSSGVASVGNAPPASAAGSGGVNREVLKQLQDVAWSDDEDDPDCMVCAEPLDLSDQNFKPCQCGLQICQFCYHKLLRDDPRCPGCRRAYDAASVVFQPVDFDEVRRVKERKAKRAKVTKQLDTMGRRHLLATRIVMKNAVYVVGMKIPGTSPEESVSILRSNDYFGQYGKIARLFLRDRTAVNPSAEASPATTTGIYIIYVRREDAARAISSLDGIPAPQGPPGQVLHASYGATRYCDAFLRSAKCDNVGCQNLHEWGGEGDCFTRNDLETALTRPQEYDARQKQQAQLQPPPITLKSAWPKPSSDEVDASALPRTANWGMRPVPVTRSGSGSGSAAGRVAPVGTARPAKIASTLVPLGKSSAFPPPQPSIPATLKADKEKKKAPAAAVALSAGMSRGRSGSSTATTATTGTGGVGGSTSAQASPKKKPPAPSQVPAPAEPAPTVISVSPLNKPSIPLPPPGLAPPPPPGLNISASSSAANVYAQHELPLHSEAGPSRLTPSPSPPPPQLQRPVEYPIHSPYPDFDDIFTSHDGGRDFGFAFSLAFDESELQRRLEEAGGLFEPSPFDPLFEELPKLGIPLASLVSLHGGGQGPIVYTGPFSPFAPSSPIDVETSSASIPNSDEPSGAASSSSVSASVEAAEPVRTSSRFEFARRGSLASARGQSPFRSAAAARAADDWARAVSANGGAGGYTPEDLRAAAAAAAAAASVHLPPHVQDWEYQQSYRTFQGQGQGQVHNGHSPNQGMGIGMGMSGGSGGMGMGAHNMSGHVMGQQGGNSGSAPSSAAFGYETHAHSHSPSRGLHFNTSVSAQVQAQQAPPPPPPPTSFPGYEAYSNGLPGVGLGGMTGLGQSLAQSLSQSPQQQVYGGMGYGQRRF